MFARMGRLILPAARIKYANCESVNLLGENEKYHPDLLPYSVFTPAWPRLTLASPKVRGGLLWVNR